MTEIILINNLNELSCLDPNKQYIVIFDNLFDENIRDMIKSNVVSITFGRYYSKYINIYLLPNSVKEIKISKCYQYKMTDYDYNTIKNDCFDRNIDLLEYNTNFVSFGKTFNQINKI